MSSHLAKTHHFTHLAALVRTVVFYMESVQNLLSDRQTL